MTEEVQDSTVVGVSSETAEDLLNSILGCISSIDKNTAIDDPPPLATIFTEYAVAAICFIISLALICGCGLGRRAADAVTNTGTTSKADLGTEPATEMTPLTTTTTTPAIQLSTRAPYKQILPLFFVVHGMVFLAGGVNHQLWDGTLDENVLKKATDGLFGLSISLLLGLGAMESIFYVCKFTIIKAPLTYLWIMLVVGSTVGAVLLGDPPVYVAGYLLVVLFLYTIVSFAQCGKPGRGYTFLQGLGLLLYCVAVVVTWVLVPICSPSSVQACNDLFPCPLPVGIFDAEALFHCLVFIAMLVYGIAKLRQIKVES